MAVSFLAVGAVCLLFALRASWRRGLRMAGITIVAAAVVAGPYFLNCWRAYGDPLYTFNVHGGVYSAAEGNGKRTASTAAYVTQMIVLRPVQILDTVAQGVTTYPFMNKWHGLDRWYSGLGDWASTPAIVGLVVLAASVPGRLLLIATAASLVPSSFTWKVDPDVRFTVHEYPVLLIAAAVALGAGFRAARAALVARRAGEPPVWSGTSWLAWASVVGIGLAGLWFVERVSPSWALADTLGLHEDAMVTVGSRGGAWFDQGLSDVIRGGNVTTRVVTTAGSLSISLPSVHDYAVTLRMDPFPRPPDDAPQRLPAVEVAINGTPLGVVTLTWSPGRVGAYDIMLPRALVGRGVNHLRLRVRRPTISPPAAIEPGLTDGDAVGLWYLRVHPSLE